MSSGVLLYDGGCGFCTLSAQWLQRRWSSSSTSQIHPSQSWTDEELRAVGLSRQQVNEAVWWVGQYGTYRGAVAVSRALRSGRMFWKVLGICMALPPISWLGRAIYPVVVRFRHRLPGASAQCEI